MARFPAFAHLYQAFATFLHNCILEDRSLLWPRQNLWTPENVAEVKMALVGNPVVDKSLNFEEKLKEQMKAAPPEGWGVLADVYYVYYLPSSSIRPETKRKFIASAAERGGFSLPAETDPVWEPLQKGFSRTGQRYNLKYAQFWALLLFADCVKRSPDRQAVLGSPVKFQDTIDSTLESIQARVDRGVDMRHAMLYLAFPDDYEPMISTQDKKAIIRVFGNKVPGALPDDLDRAILKVRQALAPELDRGGQPFNFYHPEIKAVWKDGSANPPSPPLPQPVPEGPILGVQQAMKTLEYTRNLILYGPPGTGKTFLAQKIAKELVEFQVQKAVTDELLLQRVAETHPFYDSLALALYLAGANKSLAVNEIFQLPLIQSRFRVRPVKYPREAIWGTLQNHADLESKTVKVSNKFGPALFDKDAESRWKLTPRGREYVEQSLVDAMQELQSKPADSVQAEDYILSVTFHQSYSYEDFIEGIRPKASLEETGSISYEVTPGVFRRICTKAAANPENKYVLLIDEINRGNIAKIFGEIITLIEDDKRGGEKNALSATLPYSGEELQVPGNLYLIGTMNTADRSIALLDVALRRRFAFLEVMPDPDLFGDECVVSEEGVSVHLGSLLRSLNARIVESLDRNHQIGHSYFWKVSQAPQQQRVPMLEFAWNYQVLPLLEEYFYSQRARLVELLAPFVGEFEEGADPETVEIPRTTGEDLLTALEALSNYAGIQMP